MNVLELASPPQLDTAEIPGSTSEPRAPRCERCGIHVVRAYYAVRDHVLCEMCTTTIAAAARISPQHLARAVGFGVIGAALGGLAYYIVVTRGGYPVGLVALVIGYLVARAVQLGARGRRGYLFQAIAIGLTYLAVVVAYLPFADLPDGVRSLPGALVAPFTASTAQMPISLIDLGLLALALLPGWFMLRSPAQRLIEGPFQLGASVGPALPAFSGSEEGAS